MVFFSRASLSRDENLALNMLERDDELKLLGFLATLAGLLGIVVSIGQLQIGQGTAKIVSAYFSIILVVFMFVSALTFLATLMGKDITQWNMAVFGYFSGLLGSSLR